MSRTRFVSLLTRLQRRIWLAGLTAAALIAALAHVAMEAALDTHAGRLARDLDAHYRERLALERSQLERHAERLRAQLEFMRIAELPPAQRRQRLTGFFVAQGEARDFEALMIADADDQPVFTVGCSVMLMQALGLMQVLGESFAGAPLQSHCADDLVFYWVVPTRIWLGPRGKGMALFAKALDNAFLARLAGEGDALYLRHRGRIIAASGGSARLHDRLAATGPGWARQDGWLQIALPLAPDGDPQAPVLVLRHRFEPLLSTGQVLATSGLAALGVLVLIALGLGLSVRASLVRLKALHDGAQAFTGRFLRDPAWKAARDRASLRPDEIGHLARVLDGLMQEAEARQREHLAYQRTLDLLDEVVVELDPAGRLRWVSRAWPTVTGMEAPAPGTPLAQLLNEADADALTALVASLARREKTQVGGRLRLRTDGPEERWLEIKLARMPDGEGEEALCGVLRDITQTYLQERRITHMALHDALTGLPNRVLLEDRLEMALRLALRSDHKVALGFIDLDHFKQVNDNLGHKTGDALLVEFARRLKAQMRAGDTLARWGGDEFLVLLPELPSLEAARGVAKKLHEAAQAPLELDGGDFHVTFSMGLALYPDDAGDADRLLALADRAMFQAKALGRNGLQFYADMGEGGLGRKEIYIQQRLVAAVREGRIVNHYQPILDVAGQRITGVECLARWHDAEDGWVSPAVFIPMAENLGLIHDLGRQVWRQALQDAARWREQGLALGMAVNVSRRQLFMPHFTRELLADLQASGLEPAAVTLEITESTAMQDLAQAVERLAELKAAGLNLAIDDFGTGYSSLSQLHELPVHTLKIDQSFVRRLDTPRGARLLQTLSVMAIGLGLKTVAEGVEDAAAAEALAEMGIDELQGWYIGRPMPADAIPDWVRGRRVP